MTPTIDSVASSRSLAATEALAVETMTSRLPGEGVVTRRMPRLPVLDGWRGISIVLVLAAHMLPLGPKDWQLNDAVGRMGMAIFFTLSGFLIVSTLFFHPSVRTFAIRRLTRIVPAAWLFMVVVLAAIHADAGQWRADMLFYTNLPPFHLVGITGHLWSLCVEVQFYAAIGVAFLLLRKRALALLPLVCLLVTLNRVRTGNAVSIVTIYRVDEILSGGTLAWLFHGPLSAGLKRALSRLPVIVLLTLLALACAPGLPAMNYLRPYCAAAAVGATLFHTGSWWNRRLEARPLRYLAEVSYALYVWHPLATHGWFDAGSSVVRYAKRPIGLAMSFALAHLSTFHYEKWWIGVGKRWSAPAKAERAA